MAEEKKRGEDLIEEPRYGYSDPGGGVTMETPFQETIGALTVTEGEKLEIMTRTTRNISDALEVAHNLVYSFGSKYIMSRTNQIMRLSVSQGGKGREEIVESLKAGSGVPDSFYEIQSGSNKGYNED